LKKVEGSAGIQKLVYGLEIVRDGAHRKTFLLVSFVVEIQTTFLVEALG
jgi:hypothetical protein